MSSSAEVWNACCDKGYDLHHIPSQEAPGNVSIFLLLKDPLGKRRLRARRGANLLFFRFGSGPAHSPSLIAAFSSFL
jgi:hypothetical protein